MIHSSNMSHSAQNNLLHTDIYMPPVTTSTCHTTNHTCAIWPSQMSLHPGPKLLYDYIQCFMPTRKSVDLTLYFPCLLIGSVLPINCQYHTHTHTHTRLTALFPGLPGWAGTRKVKPIWILLRQETVSGSGISWAICKSAPCSRQITTPAPHHSVFYRPDALPVAQPTASKH